MLLALFARFGLLQKMVTGSSSRRMTNAVIRVNRFIPLMTARASSYFSKRLPCIALSKASNPTRVGFRVLKKLFSKALSTSIIRVEMR